jgi:ribose-phosphate pyrophosphokinase
MVDEDTVIVQPTSPPVDRHFVELLLLTDSLKRSGARSVTAVVPYLGYQRQDHIFRDGEAVSLEVIVQAMEGAGIDKFIVFDVHSIKIPEIFKKPVVHLSALSEFAKVITNQEDRENTVLVSPDMGGIRRIKILSEMLADMPYVTVVKDRDLATGNVTAKSFDGAVKKRAIMVDDMISSGKTMVEAAELLLKNGAEEVIAMATHAIFSHEAPELLEKSRIASVIVSDTVFVPKEKQFPKLGIVSVSELIAQALR